MLSKKRRCLELGLLLYDAKAAAVDWSKAIFFDGFTVIGSAIAFMLIKAVLGKMLMVLVH